MASVVIPIFKPDKPEELRVDVPSTSRNLFERIIRDPTNPDRPARETRCSEMLCALLLNCDELRLHFLEQFAALFGWSGLPLEELEYDIETEQAIGSKRDDLRIEGYRVNDEAREHVLLWTIEIKVQAGIHQSAYQEYEDSPALALVEESVPQIENYDRWLTSQSVPHKGGIVLAIPNLQAEVDELYTTNAWRCLRWADLAVCLESALEHETLPIAEQTLAEHFLGFVWNRLMDPNEMSKNELGIDDLALIRAFATHGIPCEKKVNALVQPLTDVMAQSGISFSTEAKTQSILFRHNLRSTVWAYLIPEAASKPSPYLAIMVGISQDDAVVWSESSPSCRWKPRFQKVCKDRESALQERNPGWELIEDDSTWIDVCLKKPLTWLLIEDDQTKALQDFVRAGLEDLKLTGLIDALQTIPQETVA